MDEDQKFVSKKDQIKSYEQIKNIEINDDFRLRFVRGFSKPSYKPTLPEFQMEAK